VEMLFLSLTRRTSLSTPVSITPPFAICLFNQSFFKYLSMILCRSYERLACWEACQDRSA
jgi:hypothetical protein